MEQRGRGEEDTRVFWPGDEETSRMYGGTFVALSRL